MSFSTKTASTETETVPVKQESLATDQEAVPVPLFWGRRKIAVRWIMPAKGRIAVEAKQRLGKK